MVYRLQFRGCGLGLSRFSPARSKDSKYVDRARIEAGGEMVSIWGKGDGPKVLGLMSRDRVEV